MAIEASHRPGRVIGIDGIVFQCDADDAISALFIRPIQELSLRMRGEVRRPGWGIPLANHAGIRVRIVGVDGRVRPYVVEQLNGTLVQNVTNALSWTSWHGFKMREGRGGWDVTVPAVAFAGIEPSDVWTAIGALNRESGQPFYREFCTAFIERIFGGKHLFDDVEVLDWVVPGEGPRIPEPAAPCFKPDARLTPRARYLLRVEDRPSERRLADTRHGAQRVLFWFVSQVGRGLSWLRAAGMRGMPT
jgi:hypothetical protein